MQMALFLTYLEGLSLFTCPAQIPLLFLFLWSLSNSTFESNKHCKCSLVRNHFFLIQRGAIATLKSESKYTHLVLYLQGLNYESLIVNNIPCPRTLLEFHILDQCLNMNMDISIKTAFRQTIVVECSLCTAIDQSEVVHWPCIT